MYVLLHQKVTGHFQTLKVLQNLKPSHRAANNLHNVL